MVKKSRQPRGRIPIRFLDEEGKDGSDAATAPDGEPGDGGLTPEEIGRSSSYEDETEVRRRIDRGAEDDSTGGREHSAPSMQNCALITAPYRIGNVGEGIGTIGVVGPMRIEYARMMAVVNYTARLLERMLREEASRV